MTGRLHAWLRQALSDLAMAAYASDGGFPVPRPATTAPRLPKRHSRPCCWL